MRPVRPHLHIAMVTSHYHPSSGGVEQVVAQLAARMVAEGHHVEVLTQTQDPSLPQCEMRRGVTIRRFVSMPASRHLTAAPQLLAFLRTARARYHITHAHNYHAFPALAAALSQPRVLVVSPHYHGTGHAPIRTLLHVPYRLCGRAIFRRAAATICDSEAEAALIRRHFGGSVRCLTVIPHGVETTSIRSADPFVTDRKTVLCVGRLEEYKQVHRVIEALRHLDASFTLQVIGVGPAQRTLQALAARLGLTDRVTFHGRVDDGTLARWFRTATVYVNLSRHEAYGITILEALAAGAAVIATRIPAFVEHARRAGGAHLSFVQVDASPIDVATAIAAAARTPRAPWLDDGVLPSWDAAAAQTLRLYHQLLAR